MTIWPRFLTNFAVAAVLAAAGGIAINYTVDVAHVYRSGSLDEGAFIKRYVDKLRDTPKGLPRVTLPSEFAEAKVVFPSPDYKKA